MESSSSSSLSSSVIKSLYDIKLALPLLLFAGLFLHSFLSYRRLSHIPGPRFAALSNLWLAGVVRRKQSHLEFNDISQKYGPLARIGPNVLITSDVEQMFRMSAVRSPYVRSDWYLGVRFEAGKDHCFSMMDDKAHNKRRAQLISGYSGKENIALEPCIDRNVVKFLDLVRRKYISSASEFRPMDLAQKSNFFTLDAIMDVATGAPLGDLENDADMYDYLGTTAALLPYIAMAITVPVVQNILHLPWLAKKLFPTPEDKVGFGKIIRKAQDLIRERFSTGDATKVEKSDILQSFIRHGLTEEETVSESLLQVLAGSDTTATAFRATMLYVITNRTVYNTLRDEIATALSTPGQITRPIIRDVEARALPYLQAVIREGLRIWPPATGLGSKVVPPGGDTISGIFVPAGTKIGANYWALLHNNKDVFGEDAEVFRPERWLEAGEEERAKMERVQDLVFGYGKYGCLGKGIALTELNKIVFEFMNNFDFTLVNPTQPWTTACYALFVTSDLWVRITERGN